jgi:hypothetical protein
MDHFSRTETLAAENFRSCIQYGLFPELSFKYAQVPPVFPLRSVADPYNVAVLTRKSKYLTEKSIRLDHPVKSSQKQPPHTKRMHIVVIKIRKQ